jgi:capsular exopolysaccharide synthesis family protein
MSRIDEALKQATRTNVSPDGWDERSDVEPRAATPDPPGLDRYAVEAARPPAGTGRLSAPAPVAAVAPTAGPERFAVPPALAAKLVASPDVSQVIVEQYRRLAAVLHDLQAQQGLKTVMVTSAAPQEGKTLTIANLALTLSESYHQSVLLIDADLRRPSIHDVFGIPNNTGLSDFVNSGRSSMPVAQISRFLSVMTAGRRLASPLAMLTSDRIRAVVDDAAARFDWVLLDSPPVNLLPDAQLVARLSQGVLFVIAAGVTPYSLIQRAIGELGPERIVGTILNRAEKQLVVADSYGGYYGESAAKASLG